MLVADNTAKMNASLFDCYGELLQAGDIVRLTGGYCALYKARRALPATRRAMARITSRICHDRRGRACLAPHRRQSIPQQIRSPRRYC